MGLQAKLMVEPLGNLYEKEADQVAGRVMTKSVPDPFQTLHRREMIEEQE